MPAAIPPSTLAVDGPTGDLFKKLASAPTFEEGEIAAMRADYAGNVTLIDDQIGKLIEAVKLRGEWDNTVVVFCSDHGEMNGDHGLIMKNQFLNGAVRVPLVLRAPDTLKNHARAAVSSSPVELFDVGLTLVELAGGTLAHRQNGKSLCPSLINPAQEHRSIAVSQLRGETMVMNSH